MSWSTWIVLMAALLVGGCHAFDLVPPGRPPERVVSASLIDTSRLAGKALHRLGLEGGGLAAFIDDQGEAMTVQGSAKDGRRFHILLRKGWFGRTSARVVWNGTADDGLSEQILKELAAQAGG